MLQKFFAVRGQAAEDAFAMKARAKGFVVKKTSRFVDHELGIDFTLEHADLDKILRVDVKHQAQILR